MRAAGQSPPLGLEFTALGTAVRARGRVRPRQPFTSHVTGQEFAKLIHAGYVPTGLAMGISIASRHDDYRTRAALSRWAGNQEVPGYTQLINNARHDARNQLLKDARQHGGDGVVVDEVDLRIGEQFSLTPKTRIELRPVPAGIAKTAAPGSYHGGTPDGSRPAIRCSAWVIGPVASPTRSSIACAASPGRPSAPLARSARFFARSRFCACRRRRASSRRLSSSPRI